MEQQSIGDLQPKIEVVCRTNPFNQGCEIANFEYGVTLEDIIKSFDVNYNMNPVVLLNEWPIYPSLYSNIKPKAGSKVDICYAPNKKAFRTIATIGIAIAAAYTGGLAAGALGFTEGTLAFAAVSAGIGAGISIVGTLALNAIAPPATPSFNNLNPNQRKEDSQTYFIQGARNRPIQGGTIPVLLGKHRFTPPLAANNYTEANGNNVFARQLFCLGYGKMSVEQEKIGDTLLSSYSGVSQQAILDGQSTGTLSLYPSQVTQEDLNITVNTSFSDRTTALETDEVVVQIVFPNGLVEFDDRNKKLSKSVGFEIRYREVGGSFTTIPYTITASQTSAVIRTFTFQAGTLGAGRTQYEFGLRRTEAESTDVQIRDEIRWTVLKSFKNDNPVNKDGLCLKAIRILGTDQLNGAIDQYNLIGQQEDLVYWNGSSWVSGYSNNPAAIYRYVLQGDPAKTNITDSEIDLNTLQEWSEFCDDKGLAYNKFIDYETSREEILREIAAAGLAAPTILDNKYSVVIDKEKDTVIQSITPRNSSGYQFEKIFSEIPHGFKITFLNENKGYLQDSITVYDDGYDENNATQFEGLDFPGVTDPDQIYKLARHHLAVIRLRPVTHAVTMDIENIRFTKGDRVKLAHDVPLIGLGYARIKSVQDDGTNITGVTVDDEFTIASGTTYGVNIRLSDGTFITRTLSNSAGTTSTLTFLNPDVIANGPDVGDLIIFGESGSETTDCLVQSIEPSDDFSALVRLVDYSPAVFTASDGVIPVYDNNVTYPPEYDKPVAPKLVSVITDEAAQVVNIDGSISSRMVININNDNGFPVETVVQIRPIGDDAFYTADTLTRTNDKVIIENLVEGQLYDINIRYRRIGDNFILNNNRVSDPLQLRQIEFLGASQPPADVENFNIIIRGESVYLEWSAVNVIDLDHYEVRFSKLTSGATWGNAVVIDDNIRKEQLSLAVPSAIGTYLIRAVDTQGNKSDNATLAVTNVGAILNLNVVKTIDEDATWGGTFENTLVDNGDLKLGGSDTIDDWSSIDAITQWDYGEAGPAQSGIYYFENTEDLGEVLDVVLSFDITIGGENIFDLIDQWDAIDARTSWDGADADQYEVVMQVRTTNDDPNGSPTWSSWKRFVIGEYTARAFEFRILLTAEIADVTPVVSNLDVTIDVPDRDERGIAISSGTGGYSVTYGNAFREAPAVNITAGNLDTGDYWLITNETASGFDIEFFNSSDVSVDRTFSYYAKGYGRVV